VSKKKKKKRSSASLLGRLFASSGDRKKAARGKAQSKGGAKAAPKAPTKDESEAPPAAPLTPRQKSVREIEQMAQMGKADPERLALMLSRLLGTVRDQRDRDQADFEEMVSDILARGSEAPEDGDSEEGA